jgi:hypothetical protein
VPALVVLVVVALHIQVILLSQLVTLAFKTQAAVGVLPKEIQIRQLVIMEVKVVLVSFSSHILPN